MIVNWKLQKTFCAIAYPSGDNFLCDFEISKHQLRPGQKDLYAEIERARALQSFGERSFEGPVLRENLDDILSEPWFYLYDGKNQYEISPDVWG